MIEYHSAEPGPKRPRRIKRIDPGQRRHERLLYYVLGIFSVLQDVIGDAERRAEMPMNQSREGSGIASPNARNERRIGLRLIDGRP
jgi:hypothetical protein